MGDFGDSSADTAGSADRSGNQAGQSSGGETENHTDESSHTDEQIGSNGQKVEILPAKLVAETSVLADKNQRNKPGEIALNQKALDFLPLMLDSVMFQPKVPEKSYSMVVDLDAEVSRKLAKAPQPVQDFYKEMRQAQMDHQPIGLAAMRTKNAADAATYRDQWAEMNAWLAFPEEDKDCEEGRNTTQEYIKRSLDRNRAAAPDAAEQEKDNKLLAKIFSLMQNDHDYLHNEDELTRRDGMHHLPEAFEGIGLNGETKTFNLKALAETRMFEILQNNDKRSSFKSQLGPDDLANLAFYTQVTRQILSADLLDAANKTDRDKILKEYVAMYKLRDVDFSQASKRDWQAGMNIAQQQYPDMSRIHAPLQLDSESIYERLTLAEVRQLAVEKYERQHITTNYGKVTEPPYPDVVRMYEINKVKAPMREYREGQTLNGVNYLLGVFKGKGFPEKYLSGVFKPAGKQFFELQPKEKLRLGNWPETPAQTVKDPRGVYQSWQSVYWNDDPNVGRIQREIVARFPRSLECSVSNEGAKLARLRMSGEFISGEDDDRLSELGTSLCDKITKKTCIHDQEPRKKPQRGDKGF